MFGLFVVVVVGVGVLFVIIGIVCSFVVFLWIFFFLWKWICVEMFGCVIVSVFDLLQQ